MDWGIHTTILDDAIVKWIEALAIDYDFKNNPNEKIAKERDIAYTAWTSVRDLAYKLKLKEDLRNVRYVFEKLFKDKRFQNVAGLPDEWKDNPYRVIYYCINNAYINLEVILEAVILQRFKGDITKIAGVVHDK